MRVLPIGIALASLLFAGGRERLTCPAGTATRAFAR